MEVKHNLSKKPSKTNLRGSKKSLKKPKEEVIPPSKPIKDVYEEEKYQIEKPQPMQKDFNKSKCIAI